MIKETFTVTTSCIDRMEQYGGSSERSLALFYKYSDPSRRKEIIEAFDYLFFKYKDGGMFDIETAKTRVLDLLKATPLPPRRID